MVDGDPTTPALLPVRPEVPTPAPVLGAALVAPPPPVVWAMPMVDMPSSVAVARGRTLMAFMRDSHVFDVMWVNGAPN
jgi:hypothetical protein